MKHDDKKRTQESASAEAAKAQVMPEEKVPQHDAVKVSELTEQNLRLRADFENSKKRLERDKQEAIKFANERLLSEILDAVDNFDRAMDYFEEGHDPKKVKQGLEIAQGELHRVLEQHGVELIKSKGETFNPEWHEAVAAVEPSAEIKEGQIVDEIQKGYKLNGRLIRPSKVRVAQGSEKGSTDDKNFGGQKNGQ